VIVAEPPLRHKSTIFTADGHYGLQTSGHLSTQGEVRGLRTEGAVRAGSVARRRRRARVLGWNCVEARACGQLFARLRRGSARKKATHEGVAKAKRMRAEGPASGVSTGAGDTCPAECPSSPKRWLNANQQLSWCIGRYPVSAAFTLRAPMLARGVAGIGIPKICHARLVSQRSIEEAASTQRFGRMKRGGVSLTKFGDDLV